ncbi:recombinase family protein [Microbacterium stercoris]|uniref:Recombinase family protein n=1 Tax=Microbacterium stercoris TaxID=2820289 RepID=A0A939TP11_9MICO|nr:recombinase family protein [Microbacterium stercoris]MBO3664798.1 recombinase family protein [Microbacterium stercoris]
MTAADVDPALLVDLYLRLSIDKEGKDALERQEADLREWAASQGLTVRKVWRDAGKSGYKKGTKRPDFDAAIAAVREGEVRTLAVWKLDRLSRRGAGQVGAVLDDVDEASGRLYFLKDSLDSTVPNARMLIVMVSEQARAESANASTRIQAKKAHDRRNGRYLGGSRPWGYEVNADRKLRQHPTEAPLLREAFDRLMAGETMLTVCRDFNSRAIPTRRHGAIWRASTMSKALRSPTLSGLVADYRENREEGYEGTDIHPWRHPDTGEHVSLMAEGEPPIVTEGERMALLAVLDGRLRQYGRGMRAVKQPETLLGGGLVVCAACRRVCVSFGGSYRCRRRDFTGEPCPAPLTVSHRVLEDAVRRSWAHGLASLEPDDPILQAVADRWLLRNDPAPIRERKTLEADLATVEARIDSADHDRYVRGTLTDERHSRITEALAVQARRIRADLAALPEPQANLGALLDPELSLPAIEAAPVLEARALLRLAIDAVVVTASTGPGARFNALDRMRVIWAGSGVDAKTVDLRELGLRLPEREKVTA